MIEVQEVLEYIKFEANDYLAKDTKVEDGSVVSNHQRFVYVSESRPGRIAATPGIAWPHDASKPYLDYGETKYLSEDAEDVPGGEPERLAKHFASYLNAWVEDFSFPQELVDDIVLNVEAKRADIEINQVDFEYEDGGVGIESCGCGVSIKFQEFEESGFYYISTYRRNDADKPVCDHDYQDFLEGYELDDAERKSELAKKYANWLIDEIEAATED